jgi:hypothetical protein
MLSVRENQHKLKEIVPYIPAAPGNGIAPKPVNS